MNIYLGLGGGGWEIDDGSDMVCLVEIFGLRIYYCVLVDFLIDIWL